MISASSVTKTASVQDLLAILQIPYPFTIYSRKNDASLKGLSADKATEHLAKARHIALGDLHGSYRKLVENLVTAQLITMPKDTAKKFVEYSNKLENYLQQDPWLDKSPEIINTVQELQQNLKKLISTFKWTGGNRQLILIGDVLADRGPLDSLTLTIVDQLTEVNSKTKEEKHPERLIRIASNHDHDALRYLSGLQPASAILELTASYYRALQLAIKNPDAQEADKLFEQYARYLGASELMHYNSETGSLYTHAPVSKKIINDLSQALAAKNRLSRSKWSFLDVVKEEQFSEFVKDMNQAYQTYVRDYFSKYAKPNTFARNHQALETRLQNFLWTREPSNLLRKNQFHYIKTRIHGHDSGRKQPCNIERGATIHPNDYVVVNLDQSVRKELADPAPVKGGFKQPENNNLLFVE